MEELHGWEHRKLPLPIDETQSAMHRWLGKSVIVSIIDGVITRIQECSSKTNPIDLDRL